MGKYLLFWEIEKTRIPISSKERGEGWSLLMATVRQDMDKGLTRDWGTFVGETSGYAICEGSELEIMNLVQQYVPFCIFKVYPIAGIEHVNEMIRSMTS